MFEKCQCLNVPIQTSARSNIGHIISIDIGTFKHRHFKHWQPKVNEVSLFQVAKVPTNMYNYTLPKQKGKKRVFIGASKCVKNMPLENNFENIFFVLHQVSFCSNIDSKSSNNTYVNIIKILFYYYNFFIWRGGAMVQWSEQWTTEWEIPG